MRVTTSFNDNWTFEKEGNKTQVALPHTWNAIDGQTGPAMYYRGVCSYEKKFKTPKLQAGQQCYLEFRGVNSSCEVMLNGEKAAAHDGGYSTFRVNITELLKEENELKVLVDNGENDRVYPQKADFTFYGGIYRNVNLIVTEGSHFDLDYYGGCGVYVTPEIQGEDAVIEVVTYSVGNADEVQIVIDGVGETFLTVTEEDGRRVGRGRIQIVKAHRWQGRKDPYLYHLTANLLQNDTVLDSVDTKFGVREYAFDPEKGFFLNGVSYPLHGVSRHQDRAGVGNALTKEMHEGDVELILSMGANSIRCAHYQHDQYFYDLCDEKGIVVWAEIPYITVHMPGGRANTLSQMRELIVQNYNHASIICWALSNEITLQGVTEDLLENHKLLNDLVHRMDPHRVSAMANLFLLETDSAMVSLPDICGYNLYYGWYVGEMEDNDQWFDTFHKEHPGIRIGLTEYGADSVISLQSPKPEKGDYTEEYQALYHEHMLEMFSTRPYIWGTYCWNMFEFAAAGRDEAGDPGKNHKGLITFDRHQKKDAYYIYKAWWSEDPFVHLCGSRYHDRVEEETEIKVYSNQPSVTLWMDGEMVGTKEGSHIFTWKVKITGTHNIKVTSGELSDEMEIAKCDTPNPAYFVSAEKVRNWFDEPQEEEKAGDEFFSLDDTLGAISANPEGKALMDHMMAAMTAKTAGGMGKGVKIPKAMMTIVARQPMRKLLKQAGIAEDSEQAVQLAAALGRIRKKR